MIKLRTKTEFSIPTKRGVISGIVRFIIERLEVDINNITPIGYYYYIDENDSIIKLDNVGELTQWEIIESIETNLLGSLKSTINLKSNVLQRLEEFTMRQLATESGENYGTTPDDWEKDI